MKKIACTLFSIISCFMLQAQEDVYYFPITQKCPDGILVRKAVGPAKIISMGKMVQKSLDGPSLKKGKSTSEMIENYKKSGIIDGPIGEKIFYVNGAFYSLHSDTLRGENGVPSPCTKLMKKEDAGWISEASLTTTNSKSKPFLVPLKNGKYFVLCAYKDEEKPGTKEASIFQICRKNEKGQLELAGEEEDGLGKLRRNETVLHTLNYSGPVLFTDDYMLVFAYSVGLYWSVSLENGTVKGPERLYSGITDQLINDDRGMIRPLINAQPDPNGSIIIAARPEKSVVESSAFAKRHRDRLEILAQTQKDMPEVEFKASYKNMINEVYVEFPFVEWYRLEPRNLSLKRMDPPPTGSREMINSVEDFRKFFWIVDENDRIIYLNSSLTDFAPEEAQQPAKRATKP